VDVELACLLPRQDAAGRRWASKLSDAGVRVHTGPEAKSVGIPAVRWLASRLRSPDIDIVHVNLFNCEAAYYLSRFLHRRHYRVIRTIHNTSPPGSRLFEFAFRHSDIRSTITCGHATHAVYDGKTRGPIVCVPYGVDFDWPAHDVSQRDARLRELGVDPARTHYVQVGSQSGPSVDRAQKAQDDLIAAWRHADLGERGGVLHLLGDGHLRPTLEKLAGGDPSIMFHGIVSNVHEWMGASDTFVMPSRWEGLPLAGIEACGTGIPCVFSEIDPLRELGYAAAAFFPVGNIDALSDRLVERVGRREDCSEAGVRAIRERYGIASKVDAYLEAYRTLV
jgi:glycosyltransferase involved in cell wall biosynthesis